MTHTTPFAAIARPIAGTIGNTLIITLPRSSKVTRKCLDALLHADVVQRAVEQIRGGNGEEEYIESSESESSSSEMLPQTVQSLASPPQISSPQASLARASPRLHRPGKVRASIKSRTNVLSPPLHGTSFFTLLAFDSPPRQQPLSVAVPRHTQ